MLKKQALLLLLLHSPWCTPITLQQACPTKHERATAAVGTVGIARIQALASHQLEPQKHLCVADNDRFSRRSQVSARVLLSTAARMHYSFASSTML